MPPKPLRILSSDDDEGIRSLLFSLLTENGHDVEFAKDSDEVFKNIGRAKYDLLILDVNTPGMNGYKVAEKISSNITNRPRILIFTARNIQDEDLQFFASGADAIIRKGAPCDEILQAIEDIFAAARQENALLEEVADKRMDTVMDEGVRKDISLTTRKRMEGDLQYCLRKMTQVEDQIAVKDMRYEEFIRDLLREKQRTEKNYLEFKRIEQEVLKIKNWGYAVTALAVFSLLRSFF